jgi:hypothetical protein
VANASNAQHNDRQIGRTLFKLLIPVEMEAFLAGTGEMQIELEPETAGIPWELLDTDHEEHDPDRRPWAIRAKLLPQAAHARVPYAGDRCRPELERAGDRRT